MLREGLVVLGMGLFGVFAGAGQAPGDAAAGSAAGPARQAEIRELRSQLGAIAARLDALESEDRRTAEMSAGGTSAQPIATSASSDAKSDATAEKMPVAPVGLTAEDTTTLGFFRGTTINFSVDGYYAYNTNAPVGRVNLLRAYDVSSDSFSINQASVMVEHLPVAAPGQRFGGRVDLQFGQATETLQGSSANEQRPQAWRNLYQAYGSYLAPLGSGLQVDFGKFSSSLGVEGNYTKDQINYSRAYLYNFLPFYHMGLRANYNVTPKLNVAYWLVNGAQQTEDFNGSKSQAFLFTMKPAKTVSWTVNYYFGAEHRDVAATLNPGLPTSPTQPGLPVANLSPAPNGREHIFDSYATWTATPRLTLVGEADYVIDRVMTHSAPTHVTAGAAYARYALPRGWALGARAEYFSDRGGLFSGTTQALKETTATVEHLFAPGFVARAEYRRDFSNQRFFVTDTTGALRGSQTTATVGLVYWWGTKQGSW